jgi:murein DD-endopeptidase MepM/ murein hydrolase activator NlpD
MAAGCSSTDVAVEFATVPRGWPVDPERASISSSFGSSRGDRAHQGLDLSCPKATPVRATAAGEVEFAGRSGAYGRMVVLDHGNGWRSVFAHLKSIEVKKGRRVERGQLLGRVGKSGNATGYHLHYELRYQGRAVDPRPTLER